MGTELMLEAGFRVRFPVFVIHNATAAGGDPVELFEDAVIGPFVPVFSTEETCASAIRDRVLVGCRPVPLMTYMGSETVIPRRSSLSGLEKRGRRDGRNGSERIESEQVGMAANNQTDPRFAPNRPTCSYRAL